PAQRWPGEERRHAEQRSREVDEVAEAGAEPDEETRQRAPLERRAQDGGVDQPEVEAEREREEGPGPGGGGRGHAQVSARWGGRSAAAFPRGGHLACEILEAAWRMAEELRLPLHVRGGRRQAVLLEGAIHELEVEEHRRRQVGAVRLLPALEVVAAVA